MLPSAGQIPDIIRRRDGGHGTYYLRKPFDPAVLAELIEHALGARAESAAREVSRAAREPARRAERLPGPPNIVLSAGHCHLLASIGLSRFGLAKARSTSGEMLSRMNATWPSQKATLTPAAMV